MSLTLLPLKFLSFATHRLRSNSFLPFIFRLLSTWAPALLYLSGALNRRRNRFSVIDFRLVPSHLHRQGAV